MVALYLNEPKYWEFIRNLRNDPRVKKGFVKQKRISAKAHRKYMEKYNDRYSGGAREAGKGYWRIYVKRICETSSIR